MSPPKPLFAVFASFIQQFQEGVTERCKVMKVFPFGFLAFYGSYGPFKLGHNHPAALLVLNYSVRSYTLPENIEHTFWAKQSLTH